MDDFLTEDQDREFDLPGLAAAAGRLLSRVGASPADGRVTEIPDARTIRYYQSSGIVDPPLRYDGRRAVYGYTHLLKVVAVKLLQAQGLSLAQIQRALANATQAELQAAVREAGQISGPASTPAPSRPPFAIGLGKGRGVRSTHPSWSQREAERTQVAPGSPRRLIAAEIAPGVALLIDPEIVDHPEAIIARLKRGLRTHKGET